MITFLVDFCEEDTIMMLIIYYANCTSTNLINVSKNIFNDFQGIAST